ETIKTIDLTTNQSSDNFSFTTNFISFNLLISNNNKIVKIEALVTIEVPITKTLNEDGWHLNLDSDAVNLWDMIFQNLLTFRFSNGPPNGKRFIIKSSLELDGKNFIPNQIISQVFVEHHTNI
ncbi:36837_t:CDS:2, partial [Gigaspora margarita]